MSIFSGVRVENINNKKDLYVIERHAKRQDNSKERIDKSKTKSNYLYSDFSDRKGSINITQNFDELLKSGVKTYGKSRIGLHLIVSISSEWMKETGDIHDSKNPRNREAMRQAISWAHEKFGENSILHARMDFDEKGGGNIDLVLTPIHEISQRNTVKKVISPSKSLAKIKKEFPKGKKEFVCLQDSWNLHCKKNIDERIQRGIPKELTGIEHVHHKLLSQISEEIRTELKDDLNDSKIKNVLTKIDVCREMITHENEKKLNKTVKDEKKKISEKYDKKISELSKDNKDLSDKVDLYTNHINKQKDIIHKKNTEIQKLEKDNQDIKEELEEKNNIISKMKDYFKTLKNVPKTVLTACGLSSVGAKGVPAGRRFEGL